MQSTIPALLLIFFIAGCAGTAFESTGTGPEESGERDESMNTSTAGPAPNQGMTLASQSLLQQSRAQSRSGNYVQATASLERAIRIEPMQPILWLELGRVRLLEGDYIQAEQFGRKASSLAAGDPSVESSSLQLIGDALRGQGRYEEANQLLSLQY